MKIRRSSFNSFSSVFGSAFSQRTKSKLCFLYVSKQNWISKLSVHFETEKEIVFPPFWQVYTESELHFRRRPSFAIGFGTVRVAAGLNLAFSNRSFNKRQGRTRDFPLFFESYRDHLSQLDFLLATVSGQACNQASLNDLGTCHTCSFLVQKNAQINLFLFRFAKVVKRKRKNAITINLSRRGRREITGSNKRRRRKDGPRIIVSAHATTAQPCTREGKQQREHFPARKWQEFKLSERSRKNSLSWVRSRMLVLDPLLNVSFSSFSFPCLL